MDFRPEVYCRYSHSCLVLVLSDEQFISFESKFFLHVLLQRNYDVSLSHNKIPDALAQLAKKMAAPAMPLGQEFQPEAAIVNYFGLGALFSLVSLTFVYFSD